MIDACLASVRDLVFEMIVVDTGSTDDTRERSRRAGARVVQAEWKQDFAAARNISISYATGEWVLVLDADERLVVADTARLRLLLRSNTFDCALVRLHDATAITSSSADVVSGRARQGDAHRVARLVRRRPGLQYVGTIHEDLGPWLVKSKARIATLDLDIVHYGATEELVVGRKKVARNEQILIALATSAPTSPTALGYLAHQYLASGRLGDAWNATEEGWRRLRYVEGATDFRPSILRIAEARAQLQLLGGDARAALDTVQRTRRLEGRHYDLDYIGGYALETLAVAERSVVFRARLLERARQCFETCLASSEDVYIQAFVNGATGWAAWTRLGSVNLLLGDHDAAVVAFRASLAIRPNEVESQLGLLEATLHSCGARAALDMLDSLLGCPSICETPDLWVIAAGACESLGALTDMKAFLGKARRPKPVYVASYRRLQHAERLAGMALYRGAPVAAPGLVGAIGALAAREAVAVSDVGAWPSRLEVVRMVLANLARAGRLALVEPLFEPRADVIVPGITEHVRAAARELGIELVYQAPPAAIAVRGKDAVFVAAMLAAHPRLGARVGVTNDAAFDDTSRTINAGGPLGDPSSAIASVTRKALLDDPVGMADRLLAAIGEGGVRPLVEFLVGAYVGEERAP